MTKPLAFVLQITGVIIAAAGYGNGSIFEIFIGLALLIIGGVGIRRRIRSDKR